MKQNPAFFALLFLLSPPVASEPADDLPAPLTARLGKAPDWSTLDPFQGSISREEFVYLLNHCYARKPEDYRGIIEIFPDRALIARQSNTPRAGHYVLHFQDRILDQREPETYWRSTFELDDLPTNSAKPLTGVRIVVDPGHIGGDWVAWDDRHFKIGSNTIEIREGEMNLRVAKILMRDLSQLGAVVRPHENIERSGHLGTARIPSG